MDNKRIKNVKAMAAQMNKVSNNFKIFRISKREEKGRSGINTPIINGSILSNSEIRFILVCSKSALVTHSEHIFKFITTLENHGFVFISEISGVISKFVNNYCIFLMPTALQEKDKIVFIKVYADNSVLFHFTEVHNIDLMCKSRRYSMKTTPPFKFMETALTNSENKFSSNPLLFTAVADMPLSITTAEAVYITHKVLSTTVFGNDALERGIDNMVKKKIFLTAYPLHDGLSKWVEEEPHTDRQLLRKYWASSRAWYKQQPLNLIEKYYGTEVSFYFAWVGFYNKMLISISTVGFLCFIYGLATVKTKLNVSEEICTSKGILCPLCYKHCKFKLLKNSCSYVELAYVLDNMSTPILAIITSIWATLFMELWKRQQSLLQIRWNVTSVERDTSTRLGFVERTKFTRTSEITGETEPYVPIQKQFGAYTLTYLTSIFLVLVVVIGLFGVILYRKSSEFWIRETTHDMVLTKNLHLLATVTGSVISVIFILLFEMCYNKIALLLTRNENPRTEAEFEDSFIYKSYLMAFVNNYTVPFYIAFFKGRFYTYPGDHDQWFKLGGFQADLCDPAGCIIDLFIQLVTIVLIKYIFMNITEVLIPILKIKAKKYISKWRHTIESDKITENAPQWVHDYYLNEMPSNFLVAEYMELVIQYGFVVLFIAAFPMGPLFALLNNIAEIRIDAHKIICSHRRPVPKKVSGLGAWNGILQAVTYIAIVTNAFLISFTCQFIPREIYRYQNNSELKGFVQSTLSVFNTSDYGEDQKIGNISTCLYHGNRYPPNNPRKYELTDAFWYELAIKFVAVIIFEHVVFGMVGLLAYGIPDLPYSLKAYLQYTQMEEQKIKEEKMDKSYMESRKSIERDDSLSFRAQSRMIIETMD